MTEKQIQASDLNETQYEENPESEENNEHPQMVTSFDELVEWAKTRPKWQQDALRRLAKLESAESLSENDYSELRKILEGEVRGEKPKFEPLQHEHLPSTDSNKPKTYLKTLGPVSNIDRLAPNQPPFEFLGPKGLTVIYGLNGSGKSGYARILKNLCRAQGAVPDIKGDARNEDNSVTWKINVGYVAGIEHSLEWENGKGSPEELKQIMFFDSHTANVYVDGQRQIFYQPLELRLYSELVKVADKLKEDCKAKCKELRNALPELPALSSDTEAGKLVQSLVESNSPLPEPQSIEEMAVMGAEELDNLKKLNEKMAQGPEAREATLKSALSVLNGIYPLIKKVENILAEANIGNLRNLFNQKEERQRIASEAAEKLGQGLPIENIGTETWKTMFEAARKFATETFTDLEKPEIASADFCVLCQQELDGNAKERLSKFDEFISGELQKQASKAQQEYQKEKSNLENLSPPQSDLIGQQLSTFSHLGDTQKEQVSTITDAILSLQQRNEEVQKILNSDNWEEIQSLPPVPNPIAQQIENWIFKIEKEISQLGMSIINGETGLKAEEAIKLKELTDKKNITDSKEALLKHLCNLKKIQLLNRCAEKCSSNSITRQQKDRHELVLSSKIEQRFNNEVKDLSLGYLDIKIAEKPTKGTTDISVESNLIAGHKHRDVFSEGEQKAIALAGFLTELNETPIHHAAIFDDPVSSLDWERKRVIAKRLVDEAQKRQMIIFTHDYSFFMALKGQNKIFNPTYGSDTTDNSDTFRSLWIAKKTNKSGIMEFGITGDEAIAWNYKKVSERISKIKQDIKNLVESGLTSDATGTSAFDVKAKHIANQLRETWEVAVEEIALNNTVRRYLPDIQTQRLRQISYSSNEHYDSLHTGMSEISQFTGHAGTSEQSNGIEISDLEDNLKKLEAWKRSVTPDKNKNF